MKVLEVEFTWQVPYIRGDGSPDHKRVFRAADHSIEWVPEQRVLIIDGRCVDAHQAAWKLEDTIGRDQPSSAGGPARGAKQKRQS